MKCVACGKDADKVFDSRPSRDGHTIRRRRECLSCEHRWTTYERREDDAKVGIDLKQMIMGAMDELGDLLKKL